MEIQQESRWEEKSQPPSQGHWPKTIPPMVYRWMAARGLQDYEAFQKFSDYSLKDLKDPLTLLGLDQALERLIKAYERKEKICLYADFDMDGTPGLALLIRGLQACGFENMVSFQPNRFEDGYGVHPNLVENFIDQHGVQLFITVDVGITDGAAVSLAQKKGVDFIITDHHQVKKERPEALAIVNPNLPEDSSGLGHLCGTGVAFYLILGLRREMKNRGLLKHPFDPKSLLDCFAIGTLTDMVPLVEDNRPLVRHGLLQLARTDRVGLRLLMERLNLAGKALGSSDVAISLSPKLNALGRMNSPVQALDLFLVEDKAQAMELVDQTMEAQEQRTTIQARGKEELDGKIALKGPQPMIFEYSKNFYKGVVGLLAGGAVQDHQVCGFVGALEGDKIVGSARAPQGEDLLSALEFCGDCLKKFGGHRQAAGFELERKQAQAFESKLLEYFQARPLPSKSLSYDFQGDLEEFDDTFKFWLKKMEPYGVGFPLPRIRVNHLFVESVRVLKRKHLKFELKDMKGHQLEALWFFVQNSDEKKRELSSKRVGVILEPSINYYKGRERLQGIVRDLKVEY